MNLIRHARTLARVNLLSIFERIPCLRRRVLVNLTDNTTAIEGVLYEKRGNYLVLKNLTIHSANNKPVPMDGDAVIECAKVLFIQVVGS